MEDLKAKNYLFQTINRPTLETIMKKDTTKDILDSLRQKYQGTTRVKRVQLQAFRKEWKVIHKKTRESMSDYFARTLIISNRKKIHQEKMVDIDIIEKILRSMTSKFDYIVCLIEESNDLDFLSIDELQICLLVQEQHMNVHVCEEELH